MKIRLFSLPALLVACAFVFTSCSKDVTTDSLSISIGTVSVTTEKVQEKQNVTASFTVHLINRTEHGLNIAFLEGAIIDAKTNQGLVRFRPIIPESYGSISTAQLLPKQTKDFSVVTPPDLDAFDTATSPTVIVKMSFQTTDGYRADIVSAPVAVTVK
jgi:hypothetical protein